MTEEEAFKAKQTKRLERGLMEESMVHSDGGHKRVNPTGKASHEEVRT